MNDEIKELLYDILTGDPPIDLHMATAVEDYDLPYGSFNPYVEKAMEIYSDNPGIPVPIVNKMVDVLVAEHQREVVDYGRMLLVN